MLPAIITLTTDFGVADTYTAQLKGVILSINRHVQLVDVTHEVPPQNIRRAAAIVDEIADVFPPRTIHLVVVDPGVGTGRRLLAVEADEQGFVAPDNGVLSAVLHRLKPSRIVELTEKKFWRREVSSTFHGRDIMAQVAAHWSLGCDVAEFGPPLEDELAELPNRLPVKSTEGITGEVARIDGFGNLITNIDESLLSAAEGEVLTIEVGGQRIEGIRRAYAEADHGEFLALIGSHGRLEIAVNQGSAAQRLGAATGDRVRVLTQKTN